MKAKKGSLEGKRVRVDSSPWVKKEQNVKSGQKCWLYRKQQEKICKCNWKTKASLPKKIMESCWSNVRLGPLPQLIGFTHQKKKKKEALLSLSAQIQLETPYHNPPGSGGELYTVRHHHSQPWTSFCGLLDYWTTVR